MSRYTPRTRTFTIPDMVDRYPSSIPPGNPPDGYVITYSGIDGYYIALPPSRLQIINNIVTSPYTISETSPDDVILVTHGGTFTVNLPTAPLTGTSIFIKDFSGNASAFNITINAPGFIDGAGSYTINTNYGAIRTVFTGTTWVILTKF